MRAISESVPFIVGILRLALLAQDDSINDTGEWESDRDSKSSWLPLGGSWLANEVSKTEGEDGGN